MINIPIVILAAGSSRRMGAIKQLLPWKNTTLLGHAIEQANRISVAEVVVVLGANNDLILHKIKPYKTTIVHNKNWEMGMGTSIAKAMSHLSFSREKCDGVLFMLADQPLISTEHYKNLLKAFKKSKGNIIATSMHTKPGVPAVFDASFFKSLVKLNKDIGAKKIISENIELVYTVKTSDKLNDIDTPKDYQQLFEKFGS